MAADLSLKISVDGTDAKRNIDGVSDSLNKMGKSGDDAAKKVGAAMNEGGGHASRMGNNIMLAERAAHDLMTTLGMGGGPANIIGRLARGFDDLLLSVSRGGAGMLAFAGGMVALSAAMAAIGAVVGTIKAAFEELGKAMQMAGESEKLEIGLKDVVGSGKLAEAEMKQLKDFVTGAGAAFELKDVTQGVRQLQLFTGQAGVTNEQLKMLGAAAELNNQSFLHVADQYGKVVNAIRLGLPVRSQLLVQMQQEGLITGQTVSKVESDIKAKKDLKTTMADLNAGMQQSEASSKALGDSFEDTGKRLQQSFNIDFLEPLGEAFLPVAKNIENAFTAIFVGHKADIQNFADGVQHSLLYAFIYVRDYGLGAAFSAGVDTLAAYIRDHIKDAFLWAITTAFNLAKDAVVVFAQYVGGKVLAALQWKSSMQPTTPQDQLTAARETVQALINAGLGKGDPQFDAAMKAQTDAEKAVADAEKQQKTATDTNTNATTDNTKALQQLQAALGGLQFGGQAPPTVGPFPGAVRTMAYGPIVGEYAPAQTYGAVGHNLLQPNDIAMSVSLMQKMNLKLGDYVDILDQSGKVLLAHQHIMDTSWKEIAGVKVDTGGIETRAKVLQDWTRVQPSTSIGILRPAGPTGQETPAERVERETAEAEAEAKKNRESNQPSKTGQAAPIPGKTKEDLTQERDLTKELTNAEKDYGAQIQMVEAQKKLHMITDQQAAEKEIQLYKDEINALEGIRTKLVQQEDAAKKANDTKLVDEYKQKITELDLKVMELKGHLQDIAQTHTFGGQFQDELNKVIDQMQFTGKTAADELASSFDAIGKGLTSIIDGSTKASDAFKNMAKQIIDQLSNIAMKLLESQLLKWLGGVFGGSGGTGAAGGDLASIAAGAVGQAASSSVAGLQHGGMVYGPSGDDKVHTMLTAGEFVISKAAVARMGVDFLHTLNQSHGPYGSIRGYAAGGLVSLSPQNIPPSMSPAATAQGGNVTVATTINIGGPTSMTGISGGRGTSSTGMTKEDISQFQSVINAAIQQEIVRQKRPGGLLNKNAV